MTPSQRDSHDDTPSLRPSTTAVKIMLIEREPRLRRYIERKIPRDLRGRIDPDDVFQETCLKVFQHIHTFKPDGRAHAFHRWLFTIARNEVQNGIGKLPDAVTLTHVGPIRARGPSPATEIRERENLAQRHEKLTRAIESLPAAWQLVLSLRFLLGLPVKEVSPITGRTVEAVGAILYKSKQRLADRSSLLRLVSNCT